MQKADLQNMHLFKYYPNLIDGGRRYIGSCPGGRFSLLSVTPKRRESNEHISTYPPSKDKSHHDHGSK